MKKSVIKILVVFMISTLVFSACSSNETQDGIEFYDGNPMFQGVRDITVWAGKHVVIPAEYNGLPVKSLNDDSWLEIPSIYETLILPETIEHIYRDFYENASKNLKYNEYGNGLYLGTENNPYFAFIKPKYIETADEMSYKIDSGVNDVEKETPPTPPYDMDGSDISECVIHPDTKVMADNAFEGCQKLKSLTIPGGIKVIPQYAFAGCTSLETLVLEEGVEQINYSAIEGCYSLKEVYLPDTLDANTYMSFYECKSLENVRLPSTLKAIPERMFYGCSALQSIEIPDSVTHIGESAFGECSSLNDIYIPAGVVEIADLGVFYGCHSLESFRIDENNPNYTVIDGELRSKDGTVLIAYPAGKTDEIYTTTEEIKEIKSLAFGGNKYLKSVTINDYVEIDDNSRLFMGCSALESVKLGLGVEEIDNMFAGCTSLKYLYIPQSVKYIDAMDMKDCTSLENIEVNKNNKSFCSVDGVLYDSTKKHLIKYPAGKPYESFVIPNGVIYIDSYSFVNSKNLKSVVIATSVTEICQSAFENCESLISLTIPNSVQILKSNAFSNCTSLESVKIGSGVKEICDFAFYGCEKLSQVTLGDNLKILGNRVFTRTAITSITFPRGIEKIGYDVIELYSITYYYKGTKAEWSKIHEQNNSLNQGFVYTYTIQCSDGEYKYKSQR